MVTVCAVHAGAVPVGHTNDCIARGRDYNAGGARYNTSYIQGVGIGTITDSLAAIKKYVYERGDVTLERLVNALSMT